MLKDAKWITDKDSRKTEFSEMSCQAIWYYNVSCYYSWNKRSRTRH